MTRPPVRVVCWDWNGTLLDDVERCLRVMNTTLVAFAQPPLADVDRYRDIFRFPLRDFYADAGIGDEDYASAVDHYLAELERDDSDVPLHVGARETIAELRSRGIRQILASATRAPLLEAQLGAHSLAVEFDDVLAITDAHNASKLDVVSTWLGASGYSAAEVLMIGDTNHDGDIAAALGTRFVHYARGHQSSASVDADRIDDLRALPGLLG